MARLFGIDRDAAVLEVIDERVFLRRFVRDAEIALQLRGREGGDVLHIGVAAGDLERELLAAVQVRVLKGKRRDLFEQAVGGVQRQRVVRAAKVDAADVERHARADAGLAFLRLGRSLLGAVGAGGYAGLRFKAEAVGHVPALGFGDLHQHVLLFGVAGRVLDGRNDLVEQREVVEVSLRFEQRALVQRIARVHQQLLVHNLRAGVANAALKHLADEDLLAFGDVEGHIGLGLVGALDRLIDLNLGLVEPIAEKVPEDRVAVAGKRDQRKGLATLRLEQPLTALRREDRCRRA